jgi:predicted Zn-dependent protease with MMP-like domain
VADQVRTRRPARRDRRGRGLRGPLAPGDLPLSLTRAEQFDELVITAVTRLERRWADQLAVIEVAVEDVPGPGADPVPLGSSEVATLDRPARLVVYRRPVEARARSRGAREDLVHAVVVDQLAELLGLDRATVDPELDSDGPGGGLGPGGLGDDD